MKRLQAGPMLALQQSVVLDRDGTFLFISLFIDVREEQASL
jgi:hypothetical protein